MRSQSLKLLTLSLESSCVWQRDRDCFFFYAKWEGQVKSRQIQSYQWSYIISYTDGDSPSASGVFTSNETFSNRPCCATNEYDVPTTSSRDLNTLTEYLWDITRFSSRQSSQEPHYSAAISLLIFVFVTHDNESLMEYEGYTTLNLEMFASHRLFFSSLIRSLSSSPRETPIWSIHKSSQITIAAWRKIHEQEEKITFNTVTDTNT